MVIIICKVYVIINYVIRLSLLVSHVTSRVFNNCSSKNVFFCIPAWMSPVKGATSCTQFFHTGHLVCLLECSIRLLSVKCHVSVHEYWQTFLYKIMLWYFTNVLNVFFASKLIITAYRKLQIKNIVGCVFFSKNITFFRFFILCL